LAHGPVRPRSGLNQRPKQAKSPLTTCSSKCFSGRRVSSAWQPCPVRAPTIADLLCRVSRCPYVDVEHSSHSQTLPTPLARRSSLLPRSGARYSRAMVAIAMEGRGALWTCRFFLIRASSSSAEYGTTYFSSCHPSYALPPTSSATGEPRCRGRPPPCRSHAGPSQSGPPSSKLKPCASAPFSRSLVVPLDRDRPPLAKAGQPVLARWSSASALSVPTKGRRRWTSRGNRDSSRGLSADPRLS
jgi:hypothetical protein